MKQEFVYRTRGVCSRAINITVEDGVVLEASFVGGCNGNTQGISSLVRGMKIEDVIERLRGINCGGRGTSCPDQLSIALEEVISKS